LNKFPFIARESDTSHIEGRGYILFTGATGLVGQFLLKDLLERGQRIAALVRPTSKFSARERIEAILRRWERELGRILPRPVVLTGEVTSTELGLNRRQMKWVANHCDRIFHSAAVLQFQGSCRKNEPWLTNLSGTENVLRLGARLGIPELHYVSTAYVCGKRQSIVYEDELDCGQKFRNAYEESKYEAEKLVRGNRDFATTIYRPAVIVGDSKTGFTSTYHGLFLYLRLLAALVPQQRRNGNGVIETPIRLPMSGDEPRNLVAVDWVSNVIARIVCDPLCHGNTFHIVPDKQTTARRIIEHCYQYFNSHGVVFCGATDERPADNEFAARFFENARVYESYETSDPQFDNANLKRFVPDLPSPEIDRGVIHRFLDYGKNDNWGRNKAHPPDVRIWFEDQLPAAGKALASVLRESTQIADPSIVGFRIDGSGGGEWHFRWRGRQIFGPEASIPNQADLVLWFRSDELTSLIVHADDSEIAWTRVMRRAIPGSVLNQWHRPRVAEVNLSTH
jgi:nucleoside-diphosphate-sugar epimerase